MVKILLVEDDPEVRFAYELTLTRRGHDVRTQATGSGGVVAALDGDADIVILDAMLPDLDGFDACRAIRAQSAIPIILLTARDSDADIVGGLEAGADDYIVKPVDVAVLEARIRAALRRSVPTSRADEEVQILESGAIRVDLRSLTATKDAIPLPLSPTELRLLIVLLEHPRQVLSRDQLLDLAWPDASGGSRLVDAAVQRLRTKIEDEPDSPHFLTTVRGFGYRWGE